MGESKQEIMKPPKGREMIAAQITGKEKRSTSRLHATEKRRTIRAGRENCFLNSGLLTDAEWTILAKRGLVRPIQFCRSIFEASA
jgi:hypothetical protein